MTTPNALCRRSKFWRIVICSRLLFQRRPGCTVKDWRLIWVAFGAALAAVASVFAHVVLTGRQDTRFLAIKFSHDIQDHGEVIAAVGQCLSSFEVLSSSHAAMIKVPLKALQSKDFICLIDNLGGVKTFFIHKSTRGFLIVISPYSDLVTICRL